MKFLKYFVFISLGAFPIINGDIIKLVKNYIELHQLKKQKIELDRRYEKMKREKKLLQTSNEYLEKLARLEINMLKPGEYEFRFTPPK